MSLTEHKREELQEDEEVLSRAITAVINVQHIMDGPLTDRFIKEMQDRRDEIREELKGE